LNENSNVTIADSIMDATDECRMAFSGPPAHDDSPDNDKSPPDGGPLSIESSTIIGQVWTREIRTVSDSILLAGMAEGDDEAPIRSEKKQAGCLRFSYVPPEARVPRQYRCQPNLAVRQAIDRTTAEKGRQLNDSEKQAIAASVAARVRPVFTDLEYGRPAYAQLAGACPVVIRTGAEDESEMGVFRHLYQPQRESNLRARLNEHLRFGLDAGIFYET
jgi:hypothetical protein